MSDLWRLSCAGDLKKINLNGYTLVVPSVAVGNVAQLACDLLISSLNMKKLGIVYSTAFIPTLSYDPFDLKSSSLTGSCDLYTSEAKRFLVLQIRAPLIQKYASLFLSEVVEFFKERTVKDIVILTSSFAYEKKHMLTSHFRYIANESCPYRGKVAALNWQEHESLDNQTRIHGGGFALRLFEVCKEKSMPCLVLYKYCSEGDNIPDAYEMVQSLTSVLPLFEQTDISSQLVQPQSWKLMYGNLPPQDIY